MRLQKSTDFISNEAMIRESIIAQLIAASPASLPTDFIMVGVSYGVQDIAKLDVQKVLSGLESGGVVIKIDECDAGDRYRLADDCKISCCEDDE